MAFSTPEPGFNSPSGRTDYLTILFPVIPQAVMSRKEGVIPNKVFVGCPWKTLRPKYDGAIKRLERRYPLYFVLIGREKDQKAEELLGLIKRNLLSSTVAIFDATGGNPNVSLEYGIAEASDIDKAIYLNVHEKHRMSGRESPIIADLAGQKRNHWKTARKLEELLVAFSKKS